MGEQRELLGQALAQIQDQDRPATVIATQLLEVVDALHLLQPQCNVQISDKTPERFLKAACRVIRKGYGYPSVFNADTVIAQQLRQGKTLEDAREGGTSGCVETGAFGKEAYILTGYFNLVKVLEITLNNGRDPLTGDADADAGTVALKYHGFAGENEYDLLVAEDRDRTVVGAGGTRSIGGAILRGDLVVTDEEQGQRLGGVVRRTAQRRRTCDRRRGRGRSGSSHSPDSGAELPRSRRSTRPASSAASRSRCPGARP